MSEPFKAIRSVTGFLFSAIFFAAGAAKDVFARIPANWLYVSIIAALWYYQFAYLSTNYQPTFYFASTDWISLSQHLLNPAAWGKELQDNNTAQFRGLGYSIYLIIVTFGTLNINLIEMANYLTVLVAALFSYILFVRFLGKHVAFIIVICALLTFVPYAFAATILSEHLILALLLIFTPLCILSFVRTAFSYRVFSVITLTILCAVKTMFLPMLLVYLIYVLIEWRHMGLRTHATRYAALALSIIAAFFLTANLSSMFVANYNSGAFVFGTMNTLLYGANTDSDSLHEIYEPLFEAGVITDEKAVEILKLVNTHASDAGSESIGDEEFIDQLTAAEIKRLLFDSPTLETYWQLKWAILRGAETEAEANELARGPYIAYIKRHPAQFALNTRTSWSNFILARPHHFKYSYETEDIFRKEGGLKLYRTNIKTNERFIGLWNKRGLYFDENGARSNKLNMPFNVSVRIRESAETIYGLNAMVLGVWLILSIASCIFVLPRKASNNKKWWQWLGAAFFLQGSFIGLGLVSVILHPPLGRYLLPLFPLVTGASIASVGSAWISAAKLFAITQSKVRQ